MPTSEQITTAATLEETSETIDQTLTGGTSTSSLIIATTATMKTILNSITVPVTTRIVFFSSSTSTKPSQNSPNTLPYIVFILLFVILSAAVSVLIAYIFCCRRKRQQLIGQMSSTISDTTKTDANNIAINDSDGTRSTSNTRNISSSLLPEQSNERTSSNKYVGHMFDDKNF